MRQCDISQWLVVNSGSLWDAKSELRGDRFLLDLYSIIISREFIMPVWKPKQHLCKMWICFPEWNISHFFRPMSFPTCKRIPFFSWIVLSHYMSKYGNRKKKNKTKQPKPFLFSSFSKLSSPCFLAKKEIFLLQTLRERKKKKSTAQPVGCRSPVILLWQSKRRGNSALMEPR